jgi:hypothetical protein
MKHGMIAFLFITLLTGLTRAGDIKTGPDQQKLFLNSYKADGFKLTKIIPVNQDQFHHPHFQAGWQPDALIFMDQSTAKLKLPVAK